MATLPEKLTFKAWQRSKLLDRAQPAGARLASKVELTLTDFNTGQAASDDVTFALMAAGDIAGIKASAIKHVAPAPFARDAETTKFVHVDLWEKDLPWRYTPTRDEAHGTPDNKVLSPWLVLLVGIGAEMQVEGGLVTKVEAEVLKQHNLAESHRWAHTQFDGHSEIARILSPRGLEKDATGKSIGLLAQHEYIAALVPAFNREGQPMWHADGTPNYGSKGVLTAFYTWRFWTATAGDFETLAAALRIPPAGDVGKAKLHYRRTVPADGIDLNLTLEVRGAITSIQTPAPPDPALLQAVIDDVDHLNNELPDTIGLPHYGRPWLPNPDDFGSGWPHDLTDDPRFRGVIGLGVWMGVEAQETLMDAAVQQAGALREAGQQINHLALGLWAAGRLWERRLPTDKTERLRILGPLMARLVAADGGVVLDRVTSGSSPLPPALFSSTAQRLLRDRNTQTRHLTGANGGIDRRVAFNAANQPAPLPPPAPPNVPRFDTVSPDYGLPAFVDLLRLDDEWIADVVAQLWRVVMELSQEYRRVYNDFVQQGNLQDLPIIRQDFAEKLVYELSTQLQDRLPERDMPCEGMQLIETIGALPFFPLWEYYAQVLVSDSAQRRFYEALWRTIRRCMARLPCNEQIAQIHLPVENRRTLCDDLLGALPIPPQPTQKPLNLDALSDALYTALDPRQPNAPAHRRLCARLKGVDCSRLIPPEFPIGLDFPTWDLLRTYDKEWLLPGVGALPKDSITALQTNPAFIDAYMVGINSQFMREMRWRDLAVDRTCTPLRMFWGQVNYATQQRQADIQPLAEWAKAPDQPVGDLSHQTIQPDDATNTTGERLVIAFRTDLFRRYPSTLVYLVKPKPGSDEDALLKKAPVLEHTVDGRADREFFGPIFVGSITPEITFFAFDVKPTELDQYWLVLDEPPAELRFRNDKAAVTTNSAAFAQSTLDQPTRVAINGKELKEQGLQP